MIKQQIKILSTVALLAMTAPGMAATYSLIDPGLSNGYAYSGTITTDDSIGFFADTSAITDWSITLMTPDAVDGISSQLITMANSTLNFIPNNGTLEITASEINITSASGGLLPAGLAFLVNGDDVFLEFDGPGSSTPFGVLLQDGSETPFFGLFTGSPGPDSFTVATVIPVPAAVWLFGSGLLGLIGISRRKKA